MASEVADKSDLEVRHTRLPFLPALDGLRGLFVIPILGYHMGLGFPGALLVMSGFFALSGFLITGLLLAEWDATGRIKVGRFFANRARRLLPAAFATLGLVAVFWTLLDLQDTGQVPAQEVAANFHLELLGGLFYFHNWVRVFAPEWAGFGQFGMTDPPEISPIAHFWSLAVEEQFYLLYPLVVIAVLYLVRSKKALAVVVVVIMGVLFLITPTIGNLTGPAVWDVMEQQAGTHVRGQDLLAGVLLGIAFAYPSVRQVIRTNKWIQVAGGLTLVWLTLTWFIVHIPDRWIYEHGYLLVAVAYTVVIAALTQFSGPLISIMSLAPLRWVGERSYGFYLYHFPVLTWIDQDLVDVGLLPLTVLRLSVTTVITMMSYTFLEVPIRRRTKPTASWWWLAAGLAFVATVLTLVTI